uniref:Ribosomal protein S18 n=1 Tax=Drosera indica TaxID=16680 RepID=A0A411K3E6_9CARY|nr:ribosomal protein S18 [Drosera indica]
MAELKKILQRRINRKRIHFEFE